MKEKKIQTKKGFTIIETMIAVSLFIIIIMAGMGALLNANFLHQKSRDMRSILDSMSFVLEDMSRNLRTGYNYDCISVSTIPNVATATNGKDCVGIVFNSAASLPVSTWAYYKGTNPNNSSRLSLFKIVNGSIPVQLTPDEVSIDSTSGFSVSGATPLDGIQPFTTIKLSGTITFKGATTPFSLQTSVSQRALDR